MINLRKLLEAEWIQFWLPESLVARISFAFGDLKPIATINTINIPSPNAYDRIELETLGKSNFDFWPNGLTIEGRTIIEAELRSLVSTTIEPVTEYSLKLVDGLVASKSNLSAFNSIDAFGKYCREMADIKDLSDADAIQACKRWPEVRLNEKSSMIWDNWHNKYYLINSGGSHHIAALLYLLKKNGEELRINSRVVRHTLNFDRINNISEEFSIYIVKPVDQFDIIRFGNRSYNATAEYYSMFGIAVFHLNQVLNSPQLQGLSMVIIQHSAKLSVRTTNAMNKLLEQGVAIKLNDLIKIANDVAE